MDLTLASLAGLNTGFSAAYQQGLKSRPTYYQQVATVVPSATGGNAYPWLSNQLPGLREWIGDRQFHKLGKHGYSILNKTFEGGFEVSREEIRDDQYGVYAPLAELQGQQVASFPDTLVFRLLRAGWATLCFDGQNFFDTDHQGYDIDGAECSISNSGGGAGAPWFLLDTRWALKPLVYQEREKFQFGMLQGEDLAAPVPRSKVVKYGTNGRCNVGFGMWQQAYGSKQTLDATNFDAGLRAMGAQFTPGGDPLGFKANLLVCGPANRSAALTVVKAAVAANGATNINQNAVDVLEVEWLP